MSLSIDKKSMAFGRASDPTTASGQSHKKTNSISNSKAFGSTTNSIKEVGYTTPASSSTKNAVKSIGRHNENSTGARV
jgi:hypothetical protein